MTDTKSLRLGAVVLCGGGSERMGRAKALLDFGGQPLLTRIVGVVGQAADPVVVSCAGDQHLPPLPDRVILVPDSVPDRGPLQGLADGLARLDATCEAAFVCACDAPFVTVAYINRLADLLGKRDAVVATVGDRSYPLSAMCRVGVAAKIAHLLAGGRRRMNALLDETDVRRVAPAAWADLALQFDPLRNLNTPEEYDRAVRDLRASGLPT
ncbi:MAG: molybdenum cofactor guanylyltransferase [bacterium]|nr:molybdenum cofactor guanylyltransferase [bacterium]